MQHGVPLRGRLWKSGEDCCLRKVELRSGDVEIALGRRFDAIRLRAVEALVQVELHDLVLRIGLAQLIRERDLFDLPADGRVGRKELLLGELLWCRGSAGPDRAGANG